MLQSTSSRTLLETSFRYLLSVNAKVNAQSDFTSKVYSHASSCLRFKFFPCNFFSSLFPFHTLYGRSTIENLHYDDSTRTAPIIKKFTENLLDSVP